MKKFNWFTWEIFVLAFYAFIYIYGTFTSIGEIQEAYIWDWWHVAFGIVWSTVPLIATWSLAKKHAAQERKSICHTD